MAAGGERTPEPQVRAGQGGTRGGCPRSPLAALPAWLRGPSAGVDPAQVCGGDSGACTPNAGVAVTPGVSPPSAHVRR